MRILLFLFVVVLAGCQKSTLPNYSVLGGLRVAALELDHPEVDPGMTVTLIPLVSDYSGAGRALRLLSHLAAPSREACVV